MLANSFSAELNEHCRVLILGSMPGIVSMNEAQYYAHARNAFWPIMRSLLGMNESTELTYQQRLQRLKQQGIGLWDVYRQCFREGSLDSAIEIKTAEFNAMSELIEALPNLQCIACNGQAAGKAFKRLCKDQGITLELRGIETIILPSTSPAYAAMPFEKKLNEWQALNHFLTRES